MPASVVKSFADKTGKSVAEVEKMWDTAKKIAKKEGREEDYAYITGILKNALKIESLVNTLLGTSAADILEAAAYSSDSIGKDTGKVYTESCPICSSKYTSRCRCKIGNLSCSNGHDWYRGPNGTAILGTGHSASDEILKKNLTSESVKGFSLLLRELDRMTVILIDQEYIYRGDSLRQITVDANLERWRGLPHAGSGRFPMTPDQQINAWLKAKGYNALAKNPVHKKGTEWRITLVNLSYVAKY